MWILRGRTMQTIANGNGMEYIGTCWNIGAKATLRREQSKEKSKKNQEYWTLKSGQRSKNRKLNINLSRQVNDQQQYLWKLTWSQMVSRRSRCKGHVSKHRRSENSEARSRKAIGRHCRTRHALICIIAGTLNISESDLRDLDQCYNIQMWLWLNYGRGFSQVPFLTPPNPLSSFFQEHLTHFVLVEPPVDTLRINLL